MAGKGIRRAFRKLFRLKKTNSNGALDSGIAATPTVKPSSDLPDAHGLGNNSNSGREPFEAVVVKQFMAAATRSYEEDQAAVAKSIRMAQQAPWYWGPINAAVAESILEKEPDGTFLVRDSTDARFIFSLSCKFEGKMGHIRIEHQGGHFQFRKINHYKADNIQDFIEDAVEHSRTGKMHFMTRPRPGFEATRILLLYPLSRRRTVQSLQHLSRFVILQNIRDRNGVPELPLPLPLKKYLRQAQYFVEMNDDEVKNERARPDDESISVLE
ncbi:hypothetical protein RvY_17853 [Ramazzottius varieornatus]|uniref:Suppressor of cytokine signaling 7 n=1 Tax=Ramazzottius varieornatus TaxID=947166 RepID=A0A1D1W3U7_RAMVA|nr:hypothetical protein RvY_17853 [Ramazzottius varieornatus]